jgi:proteasome lid subunit RPN8/RPN11
MTRPVPSDLDPSERDAFTLASMMRCPAPELLSPAKEGTLPEPLRSRILEHLEKCSVCRMLADAQASLECTEPTTEELDRIRARVARAGRSQRSWWSPLAAAAVMTIALGGGWLSQFDRHESVMPAPPALPVAAPKDRVKTFTLDLEKPGIELPPGALIVRSPGSDAYVPALTTALEPFRRDDYPGAIERLSALQRTHASEPFVNYYLGVSYLLAGHAADAVAPLERARTDGSADTWLRLDASWYLAVALERAGRRDAAAVVLTEICGTGSRRQQQACGALGTLLVPRIGWRSPGAKVTIALLADADSSDRRARREPGRPIDSSVLRSLL